MANLKNVIYLSNSDYETLVTTGTVTINGTTLTYDDSNVYITPEEVATTTENGLMSSSDKTKLDSISSQTAYTAKGSATKVPQITTNSYGQVTSITEVTITQPTTTSQLTNNSNFVSGTGLDNNYIVVGNGNGTVKKGDYTISELKDIAEGKTDTYVIATKACITGTEDQQTGNFSGVSQILTAPSGGTSLDLTAMNVGDNIYIKETEVPDYWVSSKSTSNNVTTLELSKLETSKVDLTNYAPKSHATNATTYGVGTTTNYGHVKLKTGDMVALDYEDGVAASVSHSHSDYYPAANPNGYISGITSTMVTNALGYTPGTSNFTGYSSSNKLSTDYINNVAGWTSNSGTMTGVTAGAGLNTTSNDTATDGGTISTSGTLYLTKSGVTAGTYQGITVDKYGRVTNASNQGYGTYSKPSGGIPASDLAESYYLASNPSGYTSNAGTVTSVGAGTGLSISGTASVNPTVNVASGYKLPTTTEWNDIEVDSVTADTITSLGDVVLSGNVVMAEKTYADLYGAANSWADATWYFLTIRPKSLDVEWTIKYRLEIEGSNTNYQGTYQCMISGSRGAYSTYHFFNSMYSTSYRPIYYHVLHTTTSAGYTAGYGHKIGVSLYNAQNPASSSYKRTIRVILQECQNCTATLAADNASLEIPSNSAMTGYTKLNATYHTTTNSNAYGNYNLLDGYTNGLRETSDDNTVITYGTLAYYFRPYAAAYVSPYQLGFLDKDNRFLPIVSTQFPAYASGTTYAKDVYVYYSNAIYKSLQANNKGKTPSSSASWWSAVTSTAFMTPTDVAFRPDNIYWYNTTTAVAAGGLMTANALMEIGYNQPNMAICNFNAAVPAYRQIYLCGTYNTATGLFTLRGGGTAGSTNYYTFVPTNTANITLSSYFTSGYDYIVIGATYSSNNYLHLREINTMYHFDGTNLVPYDTWYAEQSGMNNPMTTQGDIIYGDSSGTPTRLAKGTAGQVLTMNSGATAPEWTTPSASVDMCISKTYSELKEMRDNGTLVPGQTYRITDYTVEYVASNKNVIAAVKNFDILVVADTTNKLNENARATLHSGDTYFASSKLEAWQLKYCIDNDTNRFNWAHSSGKGVIWYLKDEFNNSCYYDFKGIYILDTASNSAFTFGDTSNDYSLYKRTGICYNNTIEPYYNSSGVLQIGRNHIGKSSYNIHLGKGCYNNLIGEGCHEIYFDTGCYSNTIASYSYKIKFGANCYSNSFSGTSNYDVTLGTSCYSNTAASMVYCINLDNYCQSNALGQYMSYSTFGEYCSGNSFGSSCGYITLGMYSYYNAFGSNCQDIVLSSYCRSNTFGNNFYHIYLGNDCSYNKLGQGTTTNNTYDYQQNIIFDSGVQYLDFKGATSGGSSNYLKNVKVHMGVHGASTSNRKTISATRNLDYSVDYLAAGSKEVILDA